MSHPGDMMHVVRHEPGMPPFGSVEYKIRAVKNGKVSPWSDAFIACDNDATPTTRFLGYLDLVAEGEKFKFYMR